MAVKLNLLRSFMIDRVSSNMYGSFNITAEEKSKLWMSYLKIFEERKKPL
jgi:hypothetical protein